MCTVYACVDRLALRVNKGKRMQPSPVRTGNQEYRIVYRSVLRQRYYFYPPITVSPVVGGERRSIESQARRAARTDIHDEVVGVQNG